MVVFTESGPLLDISQIEEVERLVELKFPEQYKNHLLLHNGGRCMPNVYSFVENGQTTESDIQYFIAIGDSPEDDLLIYIEDYKTDEKRLPKHILPIAHDSGGNLICISCEGNDAGKVYFWDHEKEVDYSIVGDDDYSNMYLIADSFNAFIDGLRDQP